MGLDEFTPSAVNLINFLQYELEHNKREYSTLNSFRSAVSSTLGTCAETGKPVGQAPLVCRFMRGAHRLNPPKTKLFPSWDIVTILNFLKSWGPARKLSLSQLLKKSAFLVALVCYKRPADLYNMRVVKEYWYINSEGFRCQPLGYGKTESHHPIPPIQIEPFTEEPTLCPVSHLVELDGRLRNLRQKSEDRFWISAKAPHKAVSTRTLSEWLRFVIRKAGLKEGLPREVRSVGVSVAIQSNFDLKQVLAAGNWQRLSTVRRHYFRPQSLESLSQILRVAK